MIFSEKRLPPGSSPRRAFFPDNALVRHAFEAAARHRIAWNIVEGVGDLEAPLGMVGILIADQVAELIADIGDDRMISLDLDARQRLVLGHEFVVPARMGRMNKVRQLS